MMRLSKFYARLDLQEEGLQQAESFSQHSFLQHITFPRQLFRRGRIFWRLPLDYRPQGWLPSPL